MVPPSEEKSKAGKDADTPIDGVLPIHSRQNIFFRFFLTGTYIFVLPFLVFLVPETLRDKSNESLNKSQFFANMI
jgi:hypothetical protein